MEILFLSEDTKLLHYSHDAVLMGLDNRYSTVRLQLMCWLGCIVLVGIAGTFMYNYTSLVDTVRLRTIARHAALLTYLSVKLNQIMLQYSMDTI